MPTLFIQQSLAAIALAKDLNRAVHMSRFLGELLWKNSIGQYELIALENALIEKYAAQFNIDINSEKHTNFLHVLTKAYDTGGHTRIVERFINSDSLQDSAVLVTQNAGPHSFKKLSLAKNGYTQIDEQGDSHTKIQAILAVLAHCQTAILYIHPHDIETIIAVGIAKKYFSIDVLMYNHADHVFSYGYGVADRVLEISHFGWSLREQRQSDKKSVFVGIPIKLPEQAATAVARTDNAYLTAAGSAYKFKPAQGYSFPDFLSALTKKIDLPFILIGPKPWINWWWWPALLPKKLNTRRKIQFHPQMPHEQYLHYLRHTTAFIDSFPMTGGTAFPEILSMGVPCFGVLTGAHGYTPADQLKSVSVEQLTNDVVTYLKQRQRPDINSAQVINQIYEVHDTEQVAKRITTANDVQAPCLAPLWDNPAAIDSAFYEKIWQEKKTFSFPLHTLPSIQILRHFIPYWCNSRKTTSH